MFYRNWAIVALVGLFSSSLPASGQAGSVQAAIALDAQNQMPPTDFYDRLPKASGTPGELVRREDVEGYDLPEGTKATRILYWTLDSNNAPRLSSAVVVRPAGMPPRGGWPLVTWAHGTTGVGRTCGASNTKSVGYNVLPFLAQGFAVLAVDYAGLATAGPHDWILKTSNANDVVYAVPAAQQAVNDVSENWVAVGHSQGGLAVWGVAEHMAKEDDPTYLGGIAAAPGVGAEALIRNVGNQPGNTFYPVYYASAVKAHVPNFDINSMLTPLAAKHYETLVEEGCFGTAMSVFQDIAPGTVLKPGWEQLPAVKATLALSEAGNSPIKAPLLVTSGTEDISVPPEIIENSIRAQCKFSNSQLYYRRYAGGHSAMLTTSFPDMIQWIRDRFAGVEMDHRKTCRPLF